jgi:hypothetical protein
LIGKFTISLSKRIDCKKSKDQAKEYFHKKRHVKIAQ